MTDHSKSDRLKVLHVTEASLGGLRRHMNDLIVGLHEMGVEQALAFSPRRADTGMLALVEWCRSRSIQVHSIDMKRPVSLADVWVVFWLTRVIRRVRPDVLHLHSSKAGGVGRLAALVFPGLRVVYTPNGAASYISRIYLWIERALGMMRTDALVAVSNSEYKEFLRDSYVTSDRVAHVDSGIDLDEVRRMAAESSPTLPADGKIVLTVGRFAEQKDPLFLARVSARVVAQCPSAHFVWVGDGEMRQDFERTIATEGVAARWTITGWVTNPFPYFNRASAFVLCSRYESFGYVTLEAMALGKPVVGTRVAGTSDLVADGETGILIPLDDVSGFADAIVRLIQNDELAAQMGTAGLRRSERFSRQLMAARTLALYRRVAAA